MEMQGLRAHAHCVYRIFYHIAFVTKYRRRVLTNAILDRLRQHFARICANAGCGLIEFNGEEDHVHLLVEAHPNIQPSKLVNTLKTISSREIRREFSKELSRVYQKPVLWHTAYCIISAGGAPLEVLKRYIENQGKDTG